MANKKRPASALNSAPTTDVRLTPQQIEFMLTHVIRLPNLFTIAKGQNLIKAFTENEGAYRKVWEAAMAVSGTKDFFISAAEAQTAMWMHLQPKLVSDQELPMGFKEFILDHNTGLIVRIFSSANLSETLAHPLLKRFLRERLVQSPLQKKLAQAEGILISDLPQLLSEAQRLDISLSTMDDDPVESGAPENWTPVKLNKFPTGVSFIDKMLRGGHAPGEVYGVLGAYASGKTSLAVQLAYNTAKTQQATTDEYNLTLPPEDMGLVQYPKECYIFTYEATSDEIRMRLWANACSIEHGVLEEFDWSKLSTKEHLKPYEVELYKDKIKAGHKDLLLGEKERLEKHQPILRRNLWVLDMSGTGKNPKRGTGYVSEIRQIIDADLERKSRVSGRKHEVGTVVIDYAGLAAWRHIVEHGIEAGELRHYIGRFGDCCKKELAVPLGCPVWVFHQLTGEANKRTYKVQQHYTDAAESKGFAENLAFCFALGTKDEETNTLLFSCSKARRAQIGHPPTLVIEGDFFRLAESKRFTYDTKTRTFVPRSDMQGEEVSAPIANSSAALPEPPSFNGPPLDGTKA